MWIESHQELKDHPKTRRLARALDVSVPTAIGHLHCLWWFCLDYAPDGVVSHFDDWEIADAAMWDGCPTVFVDALRVTRFLDQVDGSVVVHDWAEYGGKVLEARRKSRERAARARSAPHHVDVREPYANGTGTSPNRTKQITGQDRTEQDITVVGGTPTPPEPRKGSPKQETQFTKDWTLTQDLIDWAAGRGLPEPWVRDVTDEFRYYWLSRAVRRKDWNAAWRTWVMKEARSRPPKGSAPAATRSVDWSDEAAVFGTGD